MKVSFKPLRLIMVYFGVANSFAFQPIVDNQMKENSFVSDEKFFELTDFSEMKKFPINIIFITQCRQINFPQSTIHLI